MNRGRRSGFTLLELVVVLAILAITSVAAMPAFLGAHFTTPERRVASAIVDALIWTRDAARESGSPVTFVLAPGDGRFWVTTRDSLASGTVPLENSATIMDKGTDRVTCRFDPAGPATPCAIIVHGTQTLTVHVNGWSGEVRISDEHAS